MNTVTYNIIQGMLTGWIDGKDIHYELYGMQ